MKKKGILSFSIFLILVIAIVGGIALSAAGILA